MLKGANAIYIHSKTAFLTVDTLDRALALEKGWPKLGLTIVQDQRVADLRIEMLQVLQRIDGGSVFHGDVAFAARTLR